MREISFRCPLCNALTDPKSSRCDACGVELLIEPTMIEEPKKKRIEETKKQITDEYKKEKKKIREQEKRETYMKSKKKLDDGKEKIGDIVRYKKHLNIQGEQNDN